MHPHELLEQNVGLIERLVGHACRRVGIAVDEVEDLASMIKLQLMENDYAVLRRWEQRSSLATYLTIVIQRRLADERVRTHGRWRPSAEAQRLGERGVLVEDLLARQGRSIEEALPLVRATDATVTREELAEIAAHLPHRPPRPRAVELPAEDAVPLAAPDRADARAIDQELRETAAEAGARMRAVMDGWAAEDRMLVRLRFESALNIADIARVLGVPQRPLYRRLEGLLARLRGALQAAGIDAAAADDLVSAGNRIDIDFGLAWKNGEERPTNTLSERATAEEESS